EEGAAHGEQPTGPRVRAAKATRRGDAHGAHEREAEQPARLAAEGLVEQATDARRAAEHPAAAAESLRSAGLAVDPAEAVVVEDQREDAVVARPGDPRSARRRGERHQQRPRAADGD